MRARIARQIMAHDTHAAAVPLLIWRWVGFFPAIAYPDPIGVKVAPRPLGAPLKPGFIVCLERL
jgi:hypothetical protein